jgi:hypothetical protein
MNKEISDEDLEKLQKQLKMLYEFLDFNSISMVNGVTICQVVSLTHFMNEFDDKEEAKKRLMMLCDVLLLSIKRKDEIENDKA